MGFGTDRPERRSAESTRTDYAELVLTKGTWQPSLCMRCSLQIVVGSSLLFWSNPPYSILARVRCIVDLAVACSQCEQLAQKRLETSARLKITDCILTRYENLYST